MPFFLDFATLFTSKIISPYRAFKYFASHRTIRYPSVTNITGFLMDVRLNNEKKKMQFNGTVQSLLRKLKLRREEVLVKVNGKLVPDDVELGPKDKVEIIQVVFGG